MKALYRLMSELEQAEQELDNVIRRGENPDRVRVKVKELRDKIDWLLKAERTKKESAPE